MNAEIKELTLGTSLPVVLPGLGTAGFQWFVTVSNPDCVEVVRYNYTVDTMRMEAGNSLDVVFMIHSKAPGQATIIFEQKRIWEKMNPPLNTKQLDITVVSH
ncbi:protease inhibitor I42 family protein [Chitinophaga sancti]|uniref:protease inhibitor I42 family protein n=1 Tax=Chitinophaga sancti TaxID=1004 RepID=UPI002A75954C|nr:protease inhibitor I42 family protein [Chitinophaga sancti]WPQ65919.1 protease inhibitor I42 family protein [Chitinophaga sancti]